MSDLLYGRFKNPLVYGSFIIKSALMKEYYE